MVSVFLLQKKYPPTDEELTPLKAESETGTFLSMHLEGI
jgi:hypothetical protein